MELLNIKTSKLIPYEKNPRKNDEAAEMVANSIREFGFKVPIVIDRNYVVVCGHTRLKAAKKLNIREVPCIMADDLTDEQIKAFRLADNKVSESAEWDFDLLDEELDDLFDFDMGQFGFEFYDEEEEHEQNKITTQERVSNILNLGVANFEGVGKYDIPEILPVYELPEIKEWIGFNYVMSDDNPEGKGVHFFIDDYQFERVWNDPEKYVEKLRQYACVMSPDFSPYMDMPLATQIYNHYRKHWCAKYWQENGVTVIPTIRASLDERSLEWYLDGEPKGGIVAISAVWTRDKEGKDFFVNKEYKNMYNILKPIKVYLYGGDTEGLEGDIEQIQTFARKRFGSG